MSIKLRNQKENPLQGSGKLPHQKEPAEVPTKLAMRAIGDEHQWTMVTKGPKKK